MFEKNYLNLKLESHLIYWIVFVLFFTIIWGTYDFDYKRNFIIQLLSLPARMVLVYGTLYYLIPKFLLKENYLRFVLLYFGLALLTSVLIQRSLMFFFTQHHFLHFQSDSFFSVTEIMNTVIDVNLAAIIPLGYAFIRLWQSSREKNLVLQQHNKLLSDKEGKFIYLKSNSRNNKIFLKDIVYIESLKNYIKVITVNGEIKSYNSISRVLELLPEDLFIRVHRSFIIALEHIDSYSFKSIILKGTEIPIGRKYKEDVKRRIRF